MSTATLPEVKTTPPPTNAKQLESSLAGGPAPRHDGKNLLIKIDVGPDTAMFHCHAREHVGTHNERHVHFFADKHCWLIFSNKEAFSVDYLELKPKCKTPAPVLDETYEEETECAICVEPVTTKATMSLEATQYTFRPPVIVVP